MAGFPKAERQKIIDGYLAATGRNMFVPGEFVDWLADQPEHDAYDWFFGKGDAHAAREHRIDMARNMASGLRITAQASQPPKKGKPVNVTTREYPAYVSPVAGRKAGGGYQPFDPADHASMEELRRQGATALRSWLSRYRGAFEDAGADLAVLEKLAEQFEDEFRIAS